MSIDIRERMPSLGELITAAVDKAKSQMVTSLPAKVVSYDPEKQTIKAQITVKAYVQQEDGSTKEVDYPQLEDVPVQFPGGGDQVMTFPVKEGDEVLVSFASRSVDSWQQSGGDQAPQDAGMNNLSSGFAQLGFRSQPSAQKLTGVSTSAVEMRSVDGNTRVSVSQAGGMSVATNKSVSVSAAQGVSITGGAGNVTFTGDLIVTGDIVLNGISLKNHKHTGVQPGGGTSGGPTN